MKMKKRIAGIILSFALILTMFLSVSINVNADNNDTTHTVYLSANGKTITRNITVPHTFKCDKAYENGEYDNIIKELYNVTDGGCAVTPAPTSNSDSVTCGLDFYAQYITINSVFEEIVTVNGEYREHKGIGYDIQFPYSIRISFAPPVEYPIFVGGRQVTSANMDDVFGDGKVSYTPAASGDGPAHATLTMNGANISSGYSEDNTITHGIYYYGPASQPLDIVLADNTVNTIKNDDSPFNYGIMAGSAPINISGKGKLIVSGSERGIIASNDTVTINSGTVTANGGIYALSYVNISGGAVTSNGQEYGVYTEQGFVTITGGSITASGSSGAINGTVRNSIDGTGWTDVEGVTGKVSIPVNADGQEIAYRRVKFPTAEYPVWVGDTQVTSTNQDNVLGDGTVIYTPSDDGKSGTLILTDAVIDKTSSHGEDEDNTNNIYSEGIDLKIVLNGTNIIGKENNPAFWAVDIENEIPENYKDGKYGNLTIEGNGKLIVYGLDDAFFSEGSIRINDGQVTAISDIGAAFFTHNNIEIRGGQVKAESHRDDALFASDNVEIMGGKIIANGGDNGAGICAFDDISISDGDVSAGGEYGIKSGEGKFVTINGGSITAKGNERAISGTVKNTVAGTGWTNEEGTKGKANIPVSATEGQNLVYKKVKFPADTTPAPAPSPVIDTVRQVVNMINALPDPVEIKDADAVKAARDAYDKLTEAQKKDPRLSGDVMKKLTDAEEAIESGKAQKAAGKVSEMIAALTDPSKVTADQVAEAVAAYKALSDNAKALITDNERSKLQATVDYTAASKKAFLKSVKAKKGRKAVAKWRKISKVNGYQLVYSTSKKFKKKATKKVYIKSYKAVKKTVKKLKKGKRYYFRIRTYTKVENISTGKIRNVYGKWSKVKKSKAR